MQIYNSLIELIGHTPLLRLNRYAEAAGLPFAPIAKLEYKNPAGSIKDRTALFLLDDAEKRGVLRKGGTVIEPTSGNTGVGLAMICSVRGYRLILTMPETMSAERKNLLRAYGAELVLTSGSKGMTGSVAEAERLHKEIEGSVILGQFDNPANPEAHYHTTAEELWKDTDGQIDGFIAGVGTGGTLSGTARRLKELKPSVKIYAVEPASSPLITKGISGAHKLQGIGANFIPENYDANVVDEVLDISNEDAMNCARRLAQTEGLLCGFTGGAALAAAEKIIRAEKGSKKEFIVILPDSGERYLSTDLFHD